LIDSRSRCVAGWPHRPHRNIHEEETLLPLPLPPPPLPW